MFLMNYFQILVVDLHFSNLLDINADADPENFSSGGSKLLTLKLNNGGGHIWGEMSHYYFVTGCL